MGRANDLEAYFWSLLGSLKIGRVLWGPLMVFHKLSTAVQILLDPKDLCCDDDSWVTLRSRIVQPYMQYCSTMRTSQDVAKEVLKLLMRPCVHASCFANCFVIFSAFVNEVD